MLMGKKIRKEQRGSATIEAVVSFVGFLFVIFTLLNLINFCRAQTLISNAMDTVTKELTQYSYFYQVSGLQKFDSDVQAIGAEGALNLNTVAGSVGDLYLALNTGLENGEKETTNLVNSVKDGSINSTQLNNSINSVRADGENIKASIHFMEAQFDEVADNPILYLKSIVAVAGSEGLDMVKSHAIAAPLAKALIIKHFGGDRAEADAQLESLGVVDGIDGMNFGMSTLFTKDHPDEIQLTVYYKLNVSQLFKWADFEAYMCKTSRARAWLAGDDIVKPAVAAPMVNLGGGAGEEASGGDEGTREIPPTAEEIRDQMIAKYGQDVVDAVSEGVDTGAWTVDDWEYQIWQYQNREIIEDNPENEDKTSDDVKALMIENYGEDIVNLICANNDTTDWTVQNWMDAIFIYQTYQQNQQDMLIRFQLAMIYGQNAVDIVSMGMNTLTWTPEYWQAMMLQYQNNPAEFTKTKMALIYGQSAVDAVSKGVNTSTWTIVDWQNMIVLYQADPAGYTKQKMVDLYGQEYVDAVGLGVDTSGWSYDMWEVAITQYSVDLNKSKQDAKDKFEELVSKDTDWSAPAAQAKRQEFIDTLDMYAERAVQEGACKTKLEFYEMYAKREYTYPEEYVNKIKEPYLQSGASSFVNGTAIEKAFNQFHGVGRPNEGNFTTSYSEDAALCFDGGNVKSPEEFEQIKGVSPGTYESGIYQYVYDAQFVQSCNAAGLVKPPTGQEGGANCVNIPGAKIWAGNNMGYSESELIMPVVDISAYSFEDVSKGIAENGYFEIVNPTIVGADGNRVEVQGTFRVYKHA